MMMPNSATARSTSTTAMRSPAGAVLEVCMMSRCPWRYRALSLSAISLRSTYACGSITAAAAPRSGFLCLKVRRSLRAHLGGTDSRRELQQFEFRFAIGTLEHREIGDQHVDAVRTREGQFAARFELGRAVLRVVFHDHDHAAHTRDQVHGATHSLDHLAGDHPVGEVAVFRDLERAEHGKIDVAATDHPEAVRRRKIR